MRIAIFDYRVTSTNPVGSCHLRILAGLCHEHEFTVFAVEFENPAPDRVRHVRIPVPVRPYVLLYVLYHLMAPIAFLLCRIKDRKKFDLIQFVESNLLFGDVSYSHFCHREYLKSHWPGISGLGLRGLLRLIAHKMASIFEPLVYRDVRDVVVPSQGLSRELKSAYVPTVSKTTVLPNPVDVERMRMPIEFNREAKRRSLGFAPEHHVISFVALGHFERKGLPLLLAAVAQNQDAHWRVLVVGGEKDTIKWWRERVEQSVLRDRVVFVGMQQDVRPFLWASDVFALPSSYEVFPLVTLEAAAAGLPLLVTQLNGIEEYLRPSVNGVLVERSKDGIANALTTLRGLTGEGLRSMGLRAQEDVQRYATSNFVTRWKEFYAAKYVVG